MAEIVRLPRSKPLVVLAESAQAVKLVRDEVLRSKLTYTEIARRSNVANSTVSNLATGSTKWPRLETVIRIMGGLGWRIYADRGNDR